VFHLRPPDFADAEAVLRVLQARDTADLGAPDFTLEDLLDQWRAGSGFDLRTDAVVAVDADGVIIGYATLWTPGALAVVEPAREGEGVGSALLEWTEERARQARLGVYRQWVAERNRSGQELLARAGYRHVRSYWRLVRSVEPGMVEPEPPAGVRIGAVSLEVDARALYAVHETAFATNADYEPVSFDVFRDQHLSAHDFDAGLSRVAWRDGAVVGFVLCRRWTDEGAGFVDLLGVEPGERGRGLGSTLLRCAFASFGAAGLREAQLGVASDNPSALALYERAGMTPRYRGDVFEKPVG
jgi:mycothiol synthase